MDANPTPREISLPPDSSSARSRSVSVDDTGVRRLLADGSEESVTWSDLAAVVVRVIPEGPWKEDVFLMLAAADGTGTAVPSGDPAADALIERLQMLPGFDHDTFVEAMTTDADKAYVVWKAN
ncbi:hypothetical protein [Saccharomonospora piscinae]|uniref:Uncharacterized protein n=1 Tax=Saccharomonospora piscinae TaxID=687388 RepID=A0A1V9A563_SACPI|nr:hypothetical protein [Saccharomonospora piscinae]OQO92267.1 hypothetical protein B1813_08550 [Saccharomonospora piscinae]TLW92027.1 hypothetical protein FFT09_14120 [Saccharomonospora piscinae]